MVGLPWGGLDLVFGSANTVDETATAVTTPAEAIAAGSLGRTLGFVEGACDPGRFEPGRDAGDAGTFRSATKPASAALKSGGSAIAVSACSSPLNESRPPCVGITVRGPLDAAAFELGARSVTFGSVAGACDGEAIVLGGAEALGFGDELPIDGATEDARGGEGLDPAATGGLDKVLAADAAETVAGAAVGGAEAAGAGSDFAAGFFNALGRGGRGFKLCGRRLPTRGTRLSFGAWLGAPLQSWPSAIASGFGPPDSAAIPIQKLQ